MCPGRQGAGTASRPVNEKPLIKDLGSGETSAFRQYQRMFVGRRSLWAFLRYELIAGWIAPMPGAPGYFLRSKLFPRLMRRSGRGNLFGRNIVLRAPGSIALGDRVIIDDLAVLDAKGEGSAIEVGNEVLISRGCSLSCHDATIELGNLVSIGPYCVLASRRFIKIGSNVSIGAGTSISAGGHKFSDPNVPVIEQERIATGIVIDDGVWIGTGSVVLDGAVIGENAIIGAGAVVRGEIPPYAVAAGVPARVLYDRREKAESVEAGGAVT